MVIFRQDSVVRRLARRAGESTLPGLILLQVMLAVPAQAHETRPAVADLTVLSDSAELTFSLTLEAPLAGIDLERLTDTNDAPEAERYDALRALAPEELAAQARTLWPDLSRQITLSVNGTPVPLRLDAVEVPQVGDVDLPRDTLLRLSAALPPGEDGVVFQAAPELGEIILRQQGAGDAAYAALLAPGEASVAIPRDAAALEEDAWTSVKRYVVQGFEHILPKGVDHILFVLGLFFCSAAFSALLWQVSAFTVAHTVTLALATFGVVTISPSIVEPLIALSIAYVALENIVFTRMSPWRPAVVFGFGLLHGLGFASVLGDLGLSPGHAALSLISFNVGVELGQLAVIAAAFLLVGWFRHKPWYRARIAIPVSALIGVIGLYWFFERIGVLGS
jgi:hypothetical protein